MPHSLSNIVRDCLHELTYWNRLSQLREDIKRDSGNWYSEIQALKLFVFGLLAQRRKRTRPEGIAVIRYLADGGHMTETDTEAILQNLIGPGNVVNEFYTVQIPVDNYNQNPVSLKWKGLLGSRWHPGVESFSIRHRANHPKAG